MSVRVAFVNEAPGEARVPWGPAALGLWPTLEGADLVLVWTGARLELREVGSRSGPVLVDFVQGKAAHRRTQPGAEGIARAVGARAGQRPHVLDCTAGLGRDAFVLASLGCRVTLCERNPVVWALLEDGLRRAALDPEVGGVAARMTLLRGDALTLLPTLEPQVVYLDPMYPPKKGAALPKKEMRLFHTLVGGDGDAAGVLELARLHARAKVVVKRPAGAEPLGGLRPSSSVETKNTRWDVYAAMEPGIRSRAEPH